jgi:single-stranded-DNA-specific exonuclease
MEPLTAKRWSARGPEPAVAEVQSLAASLDVAPGTARLLLLRGIGDAATGAEFLGGRLAGLPDPFLLAGMAAAAERLARAVSDGEMIAIHGDYDVDGITGTALLVENLRACGARVDYFIPLRLRDGYGLSAEALERARDGGATLAVSVDCGIGAVAEARRAQELGLDLIVTDHHHPPQHLPHACAIVNPQLPECRYPFKSLAGVGVAFLLLVALRKVLREAGWFSARPEPDLRRSLDLVALGTIADIVPLTGVNRLLTRNGLATIAARLRPGLAALMTVAGVKQASCGTVGFSLAPRLNAAGRLEDAALGVDLLLTDDGAEAERLARLLDGFNRERQALELETLRQAVARLEEAGEGGDVSIVLADERWHPGVIGIVASRLVERYGRPAVLIALNGEGGKGSARSVSGLHLYEALQECAGDLDGYGGHAMAAGLSLAIERVAAFAARFDAVVRERLGATPPLQQLWHDGEMQIEEFDLASVSELARLAPFGSGNPEPQFLLRDVRVQQLRLLGDKHLRFTARQGGASLPCIAFAFAERQRELESGAVDLLVQAQLNEWQGRTQVQLRLRDLRPAGEE